MNTRSPTANPRHPTASADVANSTKFLSVPPPPVTMIGSGELTTTSDVLFRLNGPRLLPKERANNADRYAYLSLDRVS